MSITWLRTLGAIGSMLVVPLLATSCGESHYGADACTAAGARSCDLTIGLAHTCSDYSYIGAEAESVERQQCEHPAVPDGGPTATGVWSTSPCARTGAVGGCGVTTGSVTVTTWFYGSISADTLQNACETNGGTWLTP